MLLLTPQNHRKRLGPWPFWWGTLPPAAGFLWKALVLPSATFRCGSKQNGEASAVDAAVIFAGRVIILAITPPWFPSFLPQLYH